MRSELMEKLEKALEFDAAKTMTQWNDIYSRIPDRTVYSTKYAIIELAQKQSESLKPIHEKLLECVRALEDAKDILGHCSQFGFPQLVREPDGSISNIRFPTLEGKARTRLMEALAALAKACE